MQPFSLNIKSFLDCFQLKWLKIHLYLFLFFISPLFNQVGQLRTSSHLQLRPGQDKAKQCDKKQQQSYIWDKQTYSQ